MSKHSIPSDQLCQIDQLRNDLRDILTVDLDTDLNLARWIHGWNGNIKEASKRLREYIQNRHAAKLDSDDLPDRFLTHQILHTFGIYFSFSVTDTINPRDNSIVVIQRVENIDFHGMTRILTCGHFLSLYFFVCERAFRQILKRERETGKQSGLSVIYDMENFPIWNYLNPNAAIHKIHKLCLQLMQDYYCDMLHRVYIVNAPPVVGIVLEIVKKFLNPMTQEKLIVVPDKETLFKTVDPNSLPTHFGGNFKLTEEQLRILNNANLNVNPETCAMIPRSPNEGDYFISKEFPTPIKVEYLKPKQNLRVEMKVERNRAVLWWQFRVNSDVQFSISRIREDGEQTLVVPRLTMNTPKLPEEGHVICEHAPCVYILEFNNCSTSWFNLKVEYASYVDDTDNI